MQILHIVMLCVEWCVFGCLEMGAMIDSGNMAMHCGPEGGSG